MIGWLTWFVALLVLPFGVLWAIEKMARSMWYLERQGRSDLILASANGLLCGALVLLISVALGVLTIWADWMVF